MTSNAYLLLKMKRVPQTPVPVVIGAGIFSSPAHDITCATDGEFYVELFRREGKDYSEAYQFVANEINNSGEFYDWVKFFIPTIAPGWASTGASTADRAFNSYNNDIDNRRHEQSVQKSREIKALKKELAEVNRRFADFSVLARSVLRRHRDMASEAESELAKEVLRGEEIAK